MSNLFKSAMFITSFLPLWITIFIQNAAILIESKIQLAKLFYTTEFIVIVIVAITNIVAIILVFYGIKIASQEPTSFVIKEIKPLKTITSEYLLAYVLPLFVFDFSNLVRIIQFFVYFLLLMILSIRNNNVYANIILELKGYKFYECILSYNNSVNRNYIVISNDNDFMIKENTWKRFSKLAPDVYLFHSETE
ncbi:hypothetical protein PVA45_08600 (plasmid) [Entomospira entomophila]|uniref:Uncharacterized protein n=1 Tax=Entomospira entomophila TaxID=2719988 RepID=A0A968KTL1_9SPIO|nr:hypothetical protein [Entomospira entomophilus]NIZ41567.1 hypothetical protein [Entomospira entomophilus]WDI36452.1 hypothetical protein PVA45_08600 [Entomospira entomophilus]